MQLGAIGLGRMGANIVRRARKGHACLAPDRNPAAVAAVQGGQVGGAADEKGLVSRLDKLRATWLMFPPGETTEATVAALAGLLDPGDILIEDDVRGQGHPLRRRRQQRRRRRALPRSDPSLSRPGRGGGRPTPGRAGRDPRVARGYMHRDPSGAGRLVRMVHNGIGYGLMQAYAEDVLSAALNARLRAHEKRSFPDRLPSPMRNKFGGHVEPRQEE